MRGRMKKIKWLLPVFVAVMMVGIWSGMYLQVNAKTSDNHISEGIYIESVYIGGMTAEEAEEALDAYVKVLNEKEITLIAGDKQFTAKVSDLGFTVTKEHIIEQAMSVGKTGSLLNRYMDLTDLKQGDLVLELDISVDTEIMTALLNDNINQMNTKAVNNGLIRENGKFTYIEGTTGIGVNVGPSVSLLEEYMETEWNRESAVFELSVNVTEPKGTKEELAQVKDVLGSYHTNFKSSVAARVTNIEVATARINGTILYPGEEFSVNETILQRTAANGYQKAGSYEGGQTVQSYGGGVCQVSTTLYNAIILAELEITERQNHSMTVAYVPLAMDAAIAGDYLDLKFVNNTEYPIYLEGYTQGRELYFNIYGVETRPSNRTISFETEVISQENPATSYVAAELPVGTVSRTQSGHIGYKSRLWKIVKENGVEVSREKFNTSNYKSSPRTIAVGIATDNEGLRNSVYSAIGTGDPAAIYQALYWTHPEAAAAVMQ